MVWHRAIVEVMNSGCRQIAVIDVLQDFLRTDGVGCTSDPSAQGRTRQSPRNRDSRKVRSTQDRLCIIEHNSVVGNKRMKGRAKLC